MGIPARTRSTSVVSAAAFACILTLGTAACSSGGYTTLDSDGVQRAIVNEEDFPEQDGWTSTGISSESTSAPDAQNTLGTTKGMPESCRRAFAAWTDADQQRKAGVNNNFTKFAKSANDDLENTLVVQLAVRSFEEPPTALAQLREVANACAGTMTLPQPTSTNPTTATTGTTGNKVTIVRRPVSTADADGLQISMDVNGSPTVLVTLIAQRGQNLAQVVGLGAADRGVPELAQRVLDVQVKKLEETAK